MMDDYGNRPCTHPNGTTTRRDLPRSMTAQQMYETYAAAFVQWMPTWDQIGTEQLAWHSLAEAVERKARGG